MDFKLIIKPIVLLDVEEAVNYYEKKVSGLGRRFYNQYLASVTDIQNKSFTYSYIVENV